MACNNGHQNTQANPMQHQLHTFFNLGCSRTGTRPGAWPSLSAPCSRSSASSPDVRRTYSSLLFTPFSCSSLFSCLGGYHTQQTAEPQSPARKDRSLLRQEEWPLHLPDHTFIRYSTVLYLVSHTDISKDFKGGNAEHRKHRAVSVHCSVVYTLLHAGTGPGNRPAPEII